MDIQVRNDQRGTFKVDVSIYNRGDSLGIDFNNSKSQILLQNVTASQARNMIREIEAYIEGLPKKDQPKL